MSMRVKMLDTGNVVEYEDSYAMRLIEQGDAILVSGDTPVTPTPEPLDPSQYGTAIEALQTTTTAMQAEIDALKMGATEDQVFANMFQSVSQAQERKLEYDESVLQDEIDAMAGE